MLSSKLLQKKILIFILLMVPIFSIAEILNLVFNMANFGDVNLQAIKVFRDVILLCMVLLGGTYYIGKQRLYIPNEVMVILFLSVCSIVVSLFYQPLDVVLSGCRWLEPILFYIIYLDIIDLELQNKINKVLQYLFVIGFIFQVFELFTMRAIYGVTALGTSLRNPGFFLIPSSMASFVMCVVYYIHCFETKRRIKLVLLPLAFISILLTASGTGVISFILYFLMTSVRYLKQKWAVLLFFVPILFIIPIITGRTNIFYSPLTRLEILLNSINMTNLFWSNTFGIATNTIMSLNQSLHIVNDGFIADSTITSIIANTGMLSLLIWMIFIFRHVSLKNERSICFFITFMPFFATVIIFELFPTNILFFINLAYLSKKSWFVKTII